MRGEQDDSWAMFKKEKKKKSQTNSFVQSESELARWPHSASEVERQRAMNM